MDSNKREKELREALQLAREYIGGHNNADGSPCLYRECNVHGFRLIPVLEKIDAALGGTDAQSKVNTSRSK